MQSYNLNDDQAEAVRSKYGLDDMGHDHEIAAALLDAFSDGLEAGLRAQVEFTQEGDTTGTPEHLAALEEAGIDPNDGREHKAGAAHLHINIVTGSDEDGGE